MEGRPREDAELIERARLGDVDAYEELVRRHQRVAVRTAFLVGGGAAEAEDAAQEAFVRAYHALPRFRAGAPFGHGSSRSSRTRRGTAGEPPPAGSAWFSGWPRTAPRGMRPHLPRRRSWPVNSGKRCSPRCGRCGPRTVW